MRVYPCEKFFKMVEMVITCLPTIIVTKSYEIFKMRRHHYYLYVFIGQIERRSVPNL